MRILRILMVEDDVHVRTAMTRLLRQAGHDVTAAFTATAAISLLAKEPPPDIVLLDILLDGEFGWSVAGYMLADDRLKHIPIVIVSALEPEAIRQGAMRYANLLSTASLIIEKPVDGTHLLDVIDRVTAKK